MLEFFQNPWPLSGISGFIIVQKERQAACGVQLGVEEHIPLAFSHDRAHEGHDVWEAFLRELHRVSEALHHDEAVVLHGLFGFGVVCHVVDVVELGEFVEAVWELVLSVLFFIRLLYGTTGVGHDFAAGVLYRKGNTKGT